MVSDTSFQLLHFGGHLGTAVATGLLGYWVLTRTELSGSGWIGLWLGNFAVWSTISAALVVVTHEPTAFVLFWLWAFVGLTAIYLTYLFPTAYSGRNPLTSRVCRVAGGIYALLALLVLTGPFHDLYWASVSFLQSPFPHFAVDYGVGWIAAVVYSFGAVGVVLYYFAELYFRSRRHHRQLVGLLVLGTVAGIVPVALSTADVLVPTYEYYAFAGATHALTVGYVAIRFGSVNLSTVARDETLDYLVDPYLALDTEYRIVDFNSASSQLIDRLDTSRLGEPLSDVFPALADRLTLGGRVDDPETPLTVEREGSPRYYSITLSRITDWQSTRCYAVVLTDVTELEATRRELEAQNEQLDAFVGTVSHDLRSPLSVISGRLELARMDTDTEHLDHIAEAHQRMDELIEDLLLLARQGRDVGETTAVELAAVADRAWRNVDSSEGSLVVTTDRRLLADRSRLQQLLENLMRNSLEHGTTTDHSRTDGAGDALAESETAVDGVEITLGELDDGFYLEDDGPGIPDGERQSVFEAGYTTDDDGTGFGLAIVDRIADAHGWEIQATEGTGGGARFEITGIDRVE